MFQGMPCPVCGKRGLFGVANRALREAAEHHLRLNPRWSLARCRRCGARCIARRYVGEVYREATDEEWYAHAYEEIPGAKSQRPR